MSHTRVHVYIYQFIPHHARTNNIGIYYSNYNYNNYINYNYSNYNYSDYNYSNYNYINYNYTNYNYNNAYYDNSKLTLVEVVESMWVSALSLVARWCLTCRGDI